MADIGSLAFKLTASGAQATAEMDRVRRAMQEIDREAKKTGSANWLQTRMGMGGNVSEFQAYKREAMLAARTGREQFDAQIGGGPAVASLTMFNKSMAATSRSFTDLAAKAWSTRTGIMMAFNVGAAAVKVFKGEVDEAKKLLEDMVVTGPLNKMAMQVGEFVTDKFIDPGVYTDAKNAQLALAESEKKAAREQADLRKRQSFEQQSRDMAYSRQLLVADPFTADMIRIRQFAEEQTQALKLSGVDPNSEMYKRREQLIVQTTTVMESNAIVEEDKRRKAEREAEQERQATMQAEREREAEMRADQARRMASDLQSIEAEIAAKSLALQGRTQDAERVRTKDHYRILLEEARQAGASELARLLDVEQQLALAGIDRQPNRPEQLAEQVIRGRFLQGSSESKSTKMPIIGDPQQTEYLKTMADALVRGSVARAG